jgi:hypothetical protein
MWILFHTYTQLNGCLIPLLSAHRQFDLIVSRETMSCRLPPKEIPKIGKATPALFSMGGSVQNLQKS